MGTARARRALGDAKTTASEATRETGWREGSWQYGIQPYRVNWPGLTAA